MLCHHISFHLLEDLGRPSPTVMVRVFPPGLSWDRSPCPLWNTTTLVPPPPQPSFFTLNSNLSQKRCVCSLGVGEFLCRHTVSEFILLPVIEADGQFFLCYVLVAFREHAEKFCFKVGFQQAVILGLMQDEEIILSCTEGNKHI